MASVTDRTGAAAPGGTLDFERKLWEMADASRSHMDAAEYKHVALGLIFLKYISDAFAVRYEELLAEADQGADREDRDDFPTAAMPYSPFVFPIIL
jgi:type I restriction enzyme M protein